MTAPVTAPARPFVGQTGFADAVTELQQRVAARLSADGARYAGLDALGKRLRSEGLVVEELESWVSHRAQIGLSVLTDADEDALVASVLAALGGYGPLEPLLARDDVEDIYFNGTAPTVLRLAGGRKVLGPPLAATDTQLQQMLQMLAGSGLDDSAGREFSTSRPLLQLRLKSVGLLGARMSAARDVTPHPSGTIRIHRHMEISLAQVHEQLGMIDEPLQQLLTATVLTGGKILVSGATGAGKTVLLRALCRAIPLDKMIVTVEDDRELGVHVVPYRDGHGQVVYEPDGSLRLLRPAALVRSYEARPANAEGRGEMTMGDLNRQALRDSPDVLVVGETRGADVVWFLDAASNGVANVMGTLHAESARVVFDRIVQLVRRADPPLPADFALMASTSLDRPRARPSLRTTSHRARLRLALGGQTCLARGGGHGWAVVNALSLPHRHPGKIETAAGLRLAGPRVPLRLVEPSSIPAPRLMSVGPPRVASACARSAPALGHGAGALSRCRRELSVP